MYWKHNKFTIAFIVARFSLFLFFLIAFAFASMNDFNELIDPCIRESCFDEH